LDLFHFPPKPLPLLRIQTGQAVKRPAFKIKGGGGALTIGQIAAATVLPTLINGWGNGDVYTNANPSQINADFERLLTQPVNAPPQSVTTPAR
jgi:hypothetical protein